MSMTTWSVDVKRKELCKPVKYVNELYYIGTIYQIRII